MHLQRTSTLTGERVRNSCERKYINMPIFSASHRHAHSINVLFVRSVLLLRFTKRRFQYYYYYYYVDLNWDGREGAGHCCSILDVVGISFLIMHRVDAICMCFFRFKNHEFNLGMTHNFPQHFPWAQIEADNSSLEFESIWFQFA